MSLKRLTTFG